MAAEETSHVRLHETVRTRLLDGVYRRSERIDLQQLADQMRVSTTPIREVMFRLWGEQLVSPHPAGGFQCWLPDARELRALYDWTNQQLLTTVHPLADPVLHRVMSPWAVRLGQAGHRDPAYIMAGVTHALAEAGGNDRFVITVDQANAWLHRVRIVEAELFQDWRRELGRLLATDGSDVRHHVRRRLSAYHRRRSEHAAQLAALLT